MTFSITFSYINDVDFNSEDFTNILNSFLYFNFEREIKPILASNMIPVYNDSGTWKKTDTTSEEWYNYYDKKWANAITYNHSLAYNTVTNDTELKQFNGTSDHIILGRKNYNFGKNMTLVARFKIYEYGSATQIAIGNVETTGFYLGLTSGNKIRFRSNESSSVNQTLQSEEKIQLDTWYTAVVTYDGSTIKLYVDGVLEDSVEYTNSISTSAAPLAIGGNPSTDGTITSGYFKGAISEVAVMKDSLTEEEIVQNYNNKIHHTPTKHNVLYYLKFDADDGVIANSAQYESEGISFDGVDDYISVGYSMYDFKNTFTVGARVKINSYADTEYSIFGNPQEGGFNLFKSTDNKLEVAVYNEKTSSYVNLETSFTPELNTWYTMVATYDGSSLKLYINGIEHDSLDVDIQVSVITTPFMIGVNPNLTSSLTGGYLDGMISDVILVDEALTSNQIKTYYSNDLRTIVSDKTFISYNLRSYETRENGSVIPDEMINTMWVWIPRFSATLPTNSGSINVKIVGVEDEAHDAFNFGGEELEGFWTGKFENGATVVAKDVNGNAINSNILIKPNYSSITNKNISYMFDKINNIPVLTEIYGFDTSYNTILDTHLIKNNEWAAISYFTQSKFGICDSTTCNQLEQNNSSYITGGSSYVSNTGQSTTGNVYGVYDMNGGTEEFVMGNYSNTINSLDGFLDIPDSKYLNLYTNVEDYSLMEFQHAMIETNELFNDGISNFVSESNNWVVRNNLFSYNNSNGGASDNFGSRSTLIIKT